MGGNPLCTWQSGLEKSNEETGSAGRLRPGRYYAEIEASIVNLQVGSKELQFLRMEIGI